MDKKIVPVTELPWKLILRITRKHLCTELILKDGEPAASHSSDWADNLIRWLKELK